MSQVFGLLSPSPFYGLAVLACPLAMGAMMWFMMRGGRHGQQTGESTKSMESSIGQDRDAELARLRVEIDEIRVNQMVRDNGANVERK